MNGEFEFQYPWLLTLLALLPVRVLARPVRQARRCAFQRRHCASSRCGAGGGGPGNVVPPFAGGGARIVALAGPRLADTHVETETAGLDIMLALDLSWSMMALDMGRAGERVTRFAIASDVLGNFIRKRTSDRIGLVVFSAVPYLASPLTLNHDWLIEHLKRLHVGRLQELGTAIGDAIAMSAKRLKDLPESKSRIIILLTDGDNNKGEIDPCRRYSPPRSTRRFTPSASASSSRAHCPFDPATGRLLLDPAAM
jgi:Ca-activated chloride channel family protein